MRRHLSTSGSAEIVAKRARFEPMITNNYITFSTVARADHDSIQELPVLDHFALNDPPPTHPMTSSYDVIMTSSYK